jgi:hypothetical protein
MNQELMDMAEQAGIEFTNDPTETPMTTFAECWIEELEAFAALVAAAEREACARKTEEFARKWWKIHCDSNLHYASTLRAHQDFCALQAFIRAKGETE